MVILQFKEIGEKVKQKNLVGLLTLAKRGILITV